MTVKYSVTFEFETRAPMTHRGTIAAAKVATCARLAIRDAQKALRPQNWSSMVFVALERLDTADTDVSSKQDISEIPPAA